MGYVDHARQMRGSLWQDDEYKIVFDKAVKAINQFWDDKLTNYLYDECPEITKQIDESDKRLNRLWGKSSIEDFRSELVRFYKLHEWVYKQYKGITP